MFALSAVEHFFFVELQCEGHGVLEYDLSVFGPLCWEVKVRQ